MGPQTSDKPTRASPEGGAGLGAGVGSLGTSGQQLLEQQQKVGVVSLPPLASPGRGCTISREIHAKSKRECEQEEAGEEEQVEIWRL